MTMYRSTIILTVDWNPEEECHPSTWDWEVLADTPYAKVELSQGGSLVSQKDVSDEYDEG